MENLLPKDAHRAFKPADIRGLYPTEINEQLAYSVARAVIDEFGYKTFLVGCDMRLSTPALKEAYIRGVRDAGAEVIDLGLVATPQLYFASGSLKLPGVMITASHCPRAYNGLKLVHAEAVPFTQAGGLKSVKDRACKQVWKTVAKRGGLKRKNIDKPYQAYVLKGMKPAKYKGLKLAADEGNGMAHEIIPLLRAKLPISFDTIFGSMDGRFPNRDSDPNLKENQLAISAKLRDGKYDFGISFDGDADRIAFLDADGNYVNSAAIGALIAYRILLREPKAKFVSTNFNSRIYEETIKANGGKVLMAKTGHTFLKEQMRKHDAVFGCEYSGHFFFRDFFYTDSDVFTLREVLDAYLDAKAGGQRFAEMMAPYLMYAQTEDVVIKVANKAVAMQKVHAYLKTLKSKRLIRQDGYYIDMGDVWGAVKVSVTEYAVKCMFESHSKAKAKKFQNQILKFIRSVAKDTD